MTWMTSSAPTRSGSRRQVWECGVFTAAIRCLMRARDQREVFLSVLLRSLIVSVRELAWTLSRSMIIR